MATAFLIVLGLLATAPVGPEMPRMLDDRLAIELFADAPAIVTPTSLVVDAKGRVLVIESHSHFRPEGYKGPAADRIRVFEDTDGDGKADRITTFFEGTKLTMGLGIARDGSVYVATRAEIFRLVDRDGDGTSDERTPIARLETKGAYPHNGLSGFAFDSAGDVYFGLGENLGEPYKLIGSDGTSLTGGGEGGNIYRCRPDGTKLSRVATGFWNPFHLTFDAFERLFAVDNDPDSRPPCRLLHIVDGGDYGYRFRYGRKGLHPFTAWDGELPGTLPMVAGTGEAPSGIVAYESDNLPADYRGDLLVTSWGDHRLDRFRLRERGASFRSAAEPIVTGGENFRPVGLAVAPDGSLFMSDWVDKSYELHGKGRIWHIHAKEPRRRSATDVDSLANPDRRLRDAAGRRLVGRGDEGRRALAEAVASNRDPRARAVALEALTAMGDVPATAAQSVWEDRSAEVRTLAARWLPLSEHDLRRIAGTDPSMAVRAEALRRIDDPASKSVLVGALLRDDPFLNQAAREGLKHSLDTPALLSLASEGDPALRLAALLVLRGSGRPEARRALAKFLVDPDPRVRFAAIEWVGEEKLVEYRKSLGESLAVGAVSRQLFEGYLAALELLDTPGRGPKQDVAEEYVAAFLRDPKASDALRRMALRVIRPDHPSLGLKRLKEFLASPDVGLRIEAVRTLRESPSGDRSAILADLARDSSQPGPVRAEAIVGIAGDDIGRRDLLVDLAAGDAPTLRHEALRSLRGQALTDAQRSRLSAASAGDARAAELVATLPPADRGPRPGAVDLDAWLVRLEGPADAAEGERIFFHPKGPACYRCHEIDGRGGRIGPELSTTAKSLDRKRLVASILQPSQEIAPAFVPWSIARADGTVVSGLLLGETIDGRQIYGDSSGKTFTLRATEIAERKPQSTSIMPEDLDRSMTLQEFRDLLAFLQGPAKPQEGPSR